MNGAGDGPLADLFDRAHELGTEERSRLLAEVSKADPELARRLEKLLEAASGDSPLDDDPWDRLSAELEPSEEPPPERIGPYRIISELGRGGMGRVYLGLQEGEGFARRLAIKVIAPEGDRREIERRFRQERRILALLEHPGIARFHDAGRDESGRWFLALEYVDGSNLLEHARLRELSTRDRLRLFLQVLDAVDYAHSRSVIHRDLKPSNILVGADGRPHLLDFGIAKLLDTSPTDSATQSRFQALTPAYASPEQLRGETVSAASDIFSLGILFYELLSGAHPFRGTDDSRVSVERQILETEPDPPSTASRRAAREPSLAPPKPAGLSRDLDAICLKALRKAPADRYASIAEFVADLERCLAGRPVVARAGALRFGLARSALRGPAAITAVAILALGALAIVALREGDDGDPPAMSEPQARPFPFSGIHGSDLEALEAAFIATPGDVDAGARLALAFENAGRNDEATLVVARLRQIPGHEEDPLVDYVEATIEGSTPAPQRALVLFGVALDRAIAAGRGELVGQIRAARGRLLYTLGREVEARADMESARRDFERAGDALSLARVLNDLAIEPLELGRLAEGERLLEQALAASRAGGDRPGIIHANLGLVALQRGFPDRAEARLRETIVAFTASRSRLLGAVRVSLAKALLDLGRPLDAEVELTAAVEQLNEADVEHGLAQARWLRGSMMTARGDHEGARSEAAALEAQARESGSHVALALAHRLRGEVAVGVDDLPEARRRLEDARRLLAGSGERDLLEDLEVTRAEVEIEVGDLRMAREIAMEINPDPGAPIEKTTAFAAEALLARIDVAEGLHTSAARRLSALELAAAGTTSRRRLDALEAARAAASTDRRLPPPAT